MLKSKFRRENDGDISLHLNEEGTKLLASRLKKVLREGHNLPTGPRFRRPEGSSRPVTDRGRGRGRGNRARGMSRSTPNAMVTT